MQNVITTIKTIIGDLVVIETSQEPDAATTKRITELEAQLNSLSISYEEAVKYAEEQRKRANELYKAHTQCSYQLQAAKNRERQIVSDILDSLQSVITKYKD